MRDQRQQTFLLREDRDRVFAMMAVQRAPLGLEVVVKTPKRTTFQNARLWSMLSAIEKSGFKLADRTWTADDWKEILLSAFLREKRLETGRTVLGLAGEYLVLGRLRSSDLTVDQFGEFMESIAAFMAGNGIPWAEPPAPEGDGR